MMMTMITKTMMKMRMIKVSTMMRMRVSIVVVESLMGGRLKTRKKIWNSKMRMMPSKEESLNKHNRSKIHWKFKKARI